MHKRRNNCWWTYKKYTGVGGHLFAIAVQDSIDKGYGGYIYAFAKNPDLVKHYCKKDGLNGVHIGGLHPFCVIWDEKRAMEIRRKYNFD